MKINIQNIKDFNPCIEGLNNLIKHYPNLSVDMPTFLKLEHIPYNDKIWLVRRVVDIPTLQQWGLDCAEFVMHLSDDIRVSDCIEMTKRYLLNECTLDELRNVRSAAYAARSAEYAATFAAYVADYAYYAASAADAAVSAVVSAAYAIENAAEYAASAAPDKQTQQDINLCLLIALLENK
jgi:hypothetical protein